MNLGWEKFRQQLTGIFPDSSYFLFRNPAVRPAQARTHTRPSSYSRHQLIHGLIGIANPLDIRNNAMLHELLEPLIPFQRRPDIGTDGLITPLFHAATPQ